MKKLGIGVSDFKNLREYNAYFVDKSLFIEEVINDISDVLFFPRPRRFGKTLNMSMLKYFFTDKNTEENRRLFDGLAITKSPVFEQHQGQYPVISFSLKSCKGDDFDTVYSELIRIVADVFREHEKIFEKDIFDPAEVKRFRRICNEDRNKALQASSILFLSKCLHRYYKKKVIILIDEYDTPIHEAYLNGFYDKAVNPVRFMLGNALKDNQHLHKGIITGILRVSKESMFSDLNNVKVYSVLTEKYNTWFGFTQKEVDQLLNDFRMGNSSNKVKHWYNGYYFGNEEIYNPWSILCFADSKGDFKPYWLSTSANALVHTLIKDSDQSVKKDIEDALNKAPVYSAIDEEIAFVFMKNTREHILSFLVQTGYLKARFHTEKGTNKIYRVEIPNAE